MTFSLAELLKDSAYKLTQFNATQIQALEAAISFKVTQQCPVRDLHVPGGLLKL